MKIRNLRKQSTRATMIWAAGAILAATLSGAAAAHSFSVAIIASDAESAARLPSVVRGFLVASAERDGHSDETADGHIGGLDVFVTPLPSEAANAITGLIGATPESYEVAIVLGANPAAAEDVQGVVATTIIMAPGALPSDAQRLGFEEQYQARFRAPPDLAAAQGYNAARRIDLAVRRFGDLSETAAIRQALRDSAAGIEW